jgi:hypothetical protein
MNPQMTQEHEFITTVGKDKKQQPACSPCDGMGFLCQHILVTERNLRRG